MRITDYRLCSRCCGTKVNQDYVDFEATWEGPTIISSGPVNDLVLCSDCLAEGALMIGLGDVSETVGRMERAEAEVLELRKARVEAEKRLDAIETAFEGRPKVQARAARKTPQKASK